MIGIEHLISLVSTLVQLVFEVGIAEIVEIQDTVYSYLMVTLLALVEFDFFPFLVGRRVPPTRAVDEQILRQPFDRDDLLLILDIKGIEVSPKILLFESLYNSLLTSFMPLTSVVNS
jgi:hypothetical protein